MFAHLYEEKRTIIIEWKNKKLLPQSANIVLPVQHIFYWFATTDARANYLRCGRCNQFMSSTWCDKIANYTHSILTIFCVHGAVSFCTSDIRFLLPTFPYEWNRFNVYNLYLSTLLSLLRVLFWLIHLLDLKITTWAFDIYFTSYVHCVCVWWHTKPVIVNIQFINYYDKVLSWKSLFITWRIYCVITNQENRHDKLS